MSETGEVMGYTMMSGFKPRLKEKIENKMVKGETKTTDKAMVAVMTLIN
jgi:hypothetical protein